MQLRELFIYNETYQLPKDAYAAFKPRVQNCSGNPMCLNNVKYDAETFIANFAKQIGAKIENGEESNFFITKDVEDTIKTSTKQGKQLNPAKIIILLATIFFAYKAVMGKNLIMAVVAITLGYIFSMRGDLLDNVFLSQNEASSK